MSFLSLSTLQDAEISLERSGSCVPRVSKTILNMVSSIWTRIRGQKSLLDTKLRWRQQFKIHLHHFIVNRRDK